MAGRRHHNARSVKLALRLFMLVLTAQTISGNNTHHFPDGFLFGAATAAYQIEGGWDADGKSPSIWDDLMHEQPELFAGNESSDIGADSYHQYTQDLAALRHFDFYRFSIAWSRVLPNAVNPNEAGLQYYDGLIDALLSANIQPMITMYHYDLPACLQTIGGWTNPLIRRHFLVFARLLFQRYGDRVRWWITVNEPFDFCNNGYSMGLGAPMVNGSAQGAEYLCIDNVLKSHALVYRLYRKHFHERFGGKVGITLSSNFFYDEAKQERIGRSNARSGSRQYDVDDGDFDDDDDVDADDSVPSVAVDRAMQFGLGWLTHPLFSRSGYYPPVMVEAVASNSVADGRAWSRLPQWSPAWRELVRGSADFLGLNHYTSRLVRMAEAHDLDNVPKPSMYYDRGVVLTVRPEWPQGASDWQYAVPQGFGDLLRWIRDEYDNPEVIITENGWSDRGEKRDYGRINYMRDYMNEMLRAVVDDGCNVSGYTVWSLIDNFEWMRGFTERFGLYSVDLQSSNRKRRPKLSADYMRRVIRTRTVPNE